MLVLLLRKIDVPFQFPSHTARSARMTKIQKFFKNDEAIAVTEYALLIALVAVVLVAAVLAFGTNLSSWFTAKTGSITSI